jgi:hypothetical protein
VLGLFLLTSCDAKPDRRHDMTRLTGSEQMAVRAAEDFVRSNGYTDTIVSLAATTRVSELGDEILSPEQIRSSRLNSLKPHAYGIFRGSRGRPDGWTVVFEYSPEWQSRSPHANGRSAGRAVSVAPNFKVIRIEHRDVRFEAIEKRVPESP